MTARRTHRATGVALGAALAAALLVGCAGATPGTASGSAGDELVVFAAASLADAFEPIGEEVADREGIEVVLHLAGSQALATQIEEGARADVFAAADTTQMSRVVDGGYARAEPTIVATTRLAIAVEAGNPYGIDHLDDLADPTLLVVLPGEEVPAGRYARAALDAAGVELEPASLERDVRSALGKVVLGEADAAIVYETDVRAVTDHVDAVPISDAPHARYPIVTLRDSAVPEAADAFVAYLRSADGQRLLADHGFETP